MSPVPAKFDKSQIVPLPAGVPPRFDKSSIQPIGAAGPAGQPGLGNLPDDTTLPSDSQPSFIDRLTEIQKPDPSQKWSYKEAVKALGNIGAGGLGLVLHPYEALKASVAPLVAAQPDYVRGPMGMVVPVPSSKALEYGSSLLNQVMDNPYGFLESAIGQAAVAEAAPHVAGAITNFATDTAAQGLRRLAGSGPGVTTKLVREATEQNRVIDLHNADKMAQAQQKYIDDVAKAAAEHKAELLRLRQKHAQDTRAAAEGARIGTAADRAQYQAKQLAAKQTYDQSVRAASAKHADAVAKARQANTEAQRQYNQAIGKSAQQNRAATEAERAKAAQAGQIQTAGSQLIYHLNRLDQALRARAGTMFDAVRDKVAESGKSSLPGTTLGTAARAALTKISGSSEIPKPFRDILSKYPESEPATIEYQGTQIPKGHPLYDVLAKNGGAVTPPATFADLQGYYTETGAELAKGTLPNDVYLATKDLHNAIGNMMQKMANEAGAGKEFWDSRVFYRDYMQNFHEPTGPSGSGSPIAQALLAKDPEVAVSKFSGAAGDRGIANLRKYSDSLANLAQEAQRAAQAKITVPERKSVLDIKPPKTTPVPAGPSLPLPPIMEPAPVPRAAALPLPPILPEPEAVPFRQPKLASRRTIAAEDLQRANEAAVRARASGLGRHLFWWTGVWPAFRMLSEFAKGEAVSPKPLALMPAAGATGMAMEELMSHPPVMEFLTRATRQQIAQIPPDLRGAMPDIVAAAKARGVKVSPILALYAATIQRNQAQAQDQGQAQDQTQPVPTAPLPFEATQ